LGTGTAHREDESQWSQSQSRQWRCCWEKMRRKTLLVLLRRVEKLSLEVLMKVRW
jgi:recombinational DNA repair protein RecT